MQNPNLERTLVLFKPDTVNRGLVGEILSRFERVGLKICGLKLVLASEEMARKHYTEDLEQRAGKKVRDNMVKMLTSGPVVAVCLEGIEAVELVRKMVGATEPKQAAPGTIRGDYAHVTYKHADANDIGVYNLVHASGSHPEAETEISVWFDEAELIEHKPVYTHHTIAE